MCAAYGGVNYIEMYDYPFAAVSQILVPNAIWWELERRLCLVYLGRSHSSSAVHEMVIRDLEDAGPESPKLEALRQTARLSRDAVYAGDLVALGRAMVANTTAQQNLHPKLISAEAQQVIEIAREYDALGWKVNGAGGEGGSLTVLAGYSMSRKRAMLQAIEASNPLFQSIPVYLSRYGLRVWTHSSEAPC